MAGRDQITKFLNNTLCLDQFEDTSLNGLQFEGCSEVTNVAVAVDAGLEVIKQAAEMNTQFLVVHHGLIWDKPFPFCGARKRLFEELWRKDLSVYAAHLPLDAHPDYGNNFGLARLLQLEEPVCSCNYHGQTIGCTAVNKRRASLRDLQEPLLNLPGATGSIVCLPFGPELPERIAIVSGGGADALFLHEKESFDTLITGEPRQFAFHYAKENRLNVLFAGHYATETVGVGELGRALEKEFGVQALFIDCPTGM